MGTRARADGVLLTGWVSTSAVDFRHRCRPSHHVGFGAHRKQAPVSESTPQFIRRPPVLNTIYTMPYKMRIDDAVIL